MSSLLLQRLLDRLIVKISHQQVLVRPLIVPSLHGSCLDYLPDESLYLLEQRAVLSAFAARVRIVALRVVNDLHY